MSENIPLALRNKLKSKKKYQLPNKNDFNKKYEYFKQNKYKIFFYISFAINIISFIYIFFLKKSKSSNITNLFPKKSFENNSETIDNSENIYINIMI